MSAEALLLIISGSRLAMEMAIKELQILQQKGELTDAQRAAVSEEMSLAFARDHWKPRDPS